MDYNLLTNISDFRNATTFLKIRRRKKRRKFNSMSHFQESSDRKHWQIENLRKVNEKERKR